MSLGRLNTSQGNSSQGFIVATRPPTLLETFEALDGKLRTLNEKIDTLKVNFPTVPSETPEPLSNTREVVNWEELVQKMDVVGKKLDACAEKILGKKEEKPAISSGKKTSVPPTPHGKPLEYSSPIFPKPGSSHDNFGNYLKSAGLGHMFPEHFDPCLTQDQTSKENVIVLSEKQKKEILPLLGTEKPVDPVPLPKSESTPPPPPIKSSYTYDSKALIDPRGISSCGTDDFLIAALQLIIHNRILRAAFPIPKRRQLVQHAPLCYFIEMYSKSLVSKILPVQGMREFIAKGSYSYLALGQQDVFDVFECLFSTRDVNRKALIFNSTSAVGMEKEKRESSTNPILDLHVKSLTKDQIKAGMTYLEKELHSYCYEKKQRVSFTKIPEALFLRILREGWSQTLRFADKSFITIASKKKAHYHSLKKVADAEGICKCTIYKKSDRIIYISHHQNAFFLRLRKIASDSATYEFNTITERTFSTAISKLKPVEAYIDTKEAPNFFEFADQVPYKILEESRLIPFSLPKGSILGVSDEEVITHEITAFIYRRDGGVHPQGDELIFTGHYFACIQRKKSDGTVEWVDCNNEKPLWLNDKEIQKHLKNAIFILTQRIETKPHPSIYHKNKGEAAASQQKQPPVLSKRQNEVTATEINAEEWAQIRELTKTQNAQKKNMPASQNEADDYFIQLGIKASLEEAEKKKRQSS
jgi:hypothetical protein